MKKWKRLLAALLAVTMICTMASCAGHKDSVGKDVTVTFYNGDQVYETITAKTGEKLTLPEAPKAEKGLGLAGWSTIDGDVEEIIDPETYIVRGDLKLYAVWADIFTVTINADNGSPFEVVKVLSGTLLEKPADPVKEGSRFVEWRDALKDVTFDFSKPIYDDVILKAMYGDGSPNRVSDTKWDFSGGIHGAWIGAQGGWKYEVNGLRAEDMVYKTTEDGYAAWGFTLTDSLEKIPEVNGNNAPGLGMKYIYNEGISVEASKAKLAVIYLKPKYFPIDMATSPNDQFRISVLTSNGGMIYGYGNGSDAWSLRTDGAGADMIQVDQMEDGWLRVQFKIHKLDVWSEDAILKSMSISFVQRKATPVMDIISVKSIELLDQEEFIDPHKVERTTKSEWDMSNSKDAADWDGYHAKKKHDSLDTKVTGDGMSVTYYSPGNGWKGLVLENALLDISKLTGELSFTYSSTLPITSYRIHILTDLGGKLTANGTKECYVSANVGDIELGKLPAWRRTVNADGSYTVYFDLNSLDYYANGSELKGLTIVTVTANKVTGTVTYKSIAIEKDLSEHDCEVEGHYMKEASCIAPMTCYVCGATEGGIEEHTWEAATCLAPKTCSVCRTTEGTVSGHSWKAATCQTPTTCSVCGRKEGDVAAHSYKNGFCAVCGIPEVIRTVWDMSNEKAAADWSAYHAKKKNEALTTTVTYDGMGVEYKAPGNGWKGIILEKTLIETSKLTGKLTFTYNSDMPITSYRIHILTDRGGKLTANGTDACYVAVKISDITAGNLPAWTQTTNADGSVTVTFDLNSLSYFANGKALKGLTIVTVTSNNTTGTVTYKTIDLELDAAGCDCQADGHMMKDATCTEPKTCRICGATEGEAAGHTWVDATCAEPKTCSACGTTEGEPKDHEDADGDYKCDHCGTAYCSNHNWSEATCTAPKTCSICGATEGEKLPHTDAEKNHVCDVCESSLTIWYMNTAEDAADWSGYHSKKKNEALTTTVTEAGLDIAYGGTGNGWKGIVLEEAALKISKLTGKLSFTYSSDMDITNYRIHIRTDLGGDLTDNGTADCYTNVSVAAITAGNLAAWTQTTNADGSVTVTFDLNSMGYFADGAELNGLSIVTVTANGVTGTVTHKTIELERIPGKHDCQEDGHVWKDATCQAPKTCSICGATEGETGDHTWTDATCTAPKTCSVCGATEGELGNHADGNADGKCDVCEEILCTGHTWSEATCLAPKTCSNCGATEGSALPHADSNKDHVCEACSESLSVWYMNNVADASQWQNAQAYTSTKPEVTTAAVTADGFEIKYLHKNGWKGIYMKNVEIDIAGLSGMLSFTYTEDMDIIKYRVHVLTDKGGSLEDNTSGTPSDYYAEIVIDNIAQSSAWTQTINADGSITVTFDLTTLPFFAEGAKLLGMDIVTVTETGTKGTVTYKIIALESVSTEHNCQVSGHIMSDATCTTPKTCSVCGTTEGEALGHDWADADCDTPKTCNRCGATEGEALGHDWADADCDTPKTCSVCGATEGEALGHSWKDATCQAPKTCERCSVTEGELGGHADENGDSKCDICEENLCTNHSWKDASCTAPKTCELCGTTEGEALGHDWADADCDTAKTCNRCGATEGEALGHDWAVADCDTPKTCNRCGATEGEALGHDWADADCDTAKTCNTCGATEGEALGHNWSDATCQAPKTCSTCGATEGSALPHADSNKDHVCEACSESLSVWYMNQEADAAAWTGYQSKLKNEKLTTSVTAAGMNVNYLKPGNGWKGIILEDVALDISKLDDKLTFTYSSDMPITDYRIHILTDLGGNKTGGSNANYYATANLANITAGNAAAWTQTTNADGTITVTFDLSTMGYFARGTELMALTIVTVTANETPGDITYKFIGLESVSTEHNCQVSGHIMSDATCTTPKTCSMCGATEGEALGHDWEDADCDTAKTCKTCSVTEGEALGHDWADADCDTAKTCNTCGATEGEALGHTWKDATCQTLKTCSVCGATEGQLGGHTDENEDRKCDLCGANLCTDHSWKDATCTAPKTCEHCGATDGEAAGHSWSDATCTAPKTCSVCGATEGTALTHSWSDATCTAPKTCSSCGATEGTALPHSWSDATCTAPKTCSTCGAIEGEAVGHNFVQSICTVCSAAKPAQNQWDMSNAADASDWAGYSARKKNYSLTTTVTAAGMSINYADSSTWKAIVLENTAIDIAKLTGKLSFTYSSYMEVTRYRIHIKTDLGGNLTANGTADCYLQVEVSDITAGNLEAWTQTTNADGSVTVTFDLSTMGYFADGTELNGLTILTVVSDTGTVTYKSIALEESPCWSNGHTWSDATCQAPKTCSVCGKTEGEAAEHTFAEGVCTVCGAQENAPVTPIVWNMSNQADASQWQNAQNYTVTKQEVTTAEVTADGFKVNYGHKNAWKGIVLKDAEFDITGLNQLSFTYSSEMRITEYRVHVLTDKGGDLGSNNTGTPSDYYAAIAIDAIGQSSAWTRTENADGSITVTFDLTTLPYFAEGTKLLGMDIVTVCGTVTGEWHSITYRSIEIR